MKCRVCSGDDLKLFLSLGTTPLANSFVKREELGQPEARFPLEVSVCPGCKLVQLNHVVPPHVMFKDYVYVTSTTQTFRDHFGAMAKDISTQHNLGAGLAVDIGSNDGLLLSGFKNAGMSVVGVEPATNIAAIARNNGIDTINDFFSKAVVEQIVRTKGNADIVTATNVFAHIDDIHDVARNVRSLLKTDGMFVIEAPYLLDMVEQMTFDTVYHEHLSYFSLTPLVQFFQLHDMDVFDVQRVASHGGSLRVFVKKHEGKHPVTPAVRLLLARENNAGVNDLTFYSQFGTKVHETKDMLVRHINTIRNAGKKIAAYGAPAKGNTLLNFCGIGPKQIEYIVDDNPLKAGLYAPGTNIPVVSSSHLDTNRPDYVLVLAWNFAPEILAKTKKYADAGVKFIIPLPTPRLVEQETPMTPVQNEVVRRITPAFEDARGMIANILEEPVSHIAIITSTKGSIRANHYHPEQIQYLYLISGAYESTSKDLRVKDAPLQTIPVKAGDLVITQPMIAHAMRFTQDSVMLNITTGQRESKNFTEHTVAYKLI